jgi:hypothetical protein
MTYREGWTRRSYCRPDAASRVELGFPRDFHARDLVKGLVYGGLQDRMDM